MRNGGENVGRSSMGESATEVVTKVTDGSSGQARVWFADNLINRRLND